MCLAGLTAGMPSSFKVKDGPSSIPATDLDQDQLRETVTLIEKFIPPIFKAINDDSDDPTTRLNKLVDTSLLLSREAVKLRKPTATNQEVLEEVEAARETMPLIMDILRASIDSFKSNSFDGLFDSFDVNSDFKVKIEK